MKRKALLLLVMTSFITLLYAQKTPKTAGYAITAPQKGQTSWKEVRLVDGATGEEMKTIYQSTQQMEILNARTGKPVVKKDAPTVSKDVSLFNAGKVSFTAPTVVTGVRITQSAVKEDKLTAVAPARKVINLDDELAKKDLKERVIVLKTNAANEVQLTRSDISSPDLRFPLMENVKVAVKSTPANADVKLVPAPTVMNLQFGDITVRGTYKMQTDKPFSTNSAALAYDKKHERLYYTPLFINQLRYIDLKSKTPRIYYFEDEPFGTVSGPGDANNQITRMVIASDGNGYALTNSGDHLIRFTTGKKPVITDLGSLTDDPSNGAFSVHNRNGFGGDMVADASENLYLITASRTVFKISLKSMQATYLGTIKGLPKGFSTNGAMVEEGSKIIVCSSESTFGYFVFDLNTMQAEKASSGPSVFNASDLANGNLAFEKKKSDPPVKEEITGETVKQALLQDLLAKNAISVYPNPVTNGFVKLVFANQPAGKYNVQFMDIAGKVINSQDVVINSNSQVEEFRLSDLMVKGNYLVKVVSENNKVSIVNKLVVQ